MKFSFTKETDLCSNCWKHKAVVSNITYEYFDEINDQNNLLYAIINYVKDPKFWGQMQFQIL